MSRGNKMPKLLSACILAVFAGVLALAGQPDEQLMAEQEYRQLREAAVLDGQKQPAEEASGTGEAMEQKQEPEIPIDFSVLQESNKDVYAWLEIPGTAIEYPVLQHESDDAYYLEHTIGHEEGLPGAIYSECSSAKDFSGFIHILYGHNMKNGTMFTDLHKFEAEDFFAQHGEIRVYTPEHAYTYNIIAATVMSDDHLMYRYDFTTEDGKAEYLQALRSEDDARNHYREGVEVTAEDRLLVLSTCVSGESDRRYVVTAVLTEAGANVK